MIDYSPRVVSTSGAPSSVHPSVRATSARARSVRAHVFPPRVRRVSSRRVASRLPAAAVVTARVARDVGCARPHVPLGARSTRRALEDGRARSLDATRVESPRDDRERSTARGEE